MDLESSVEQVTLRWKRDNKNNILFSQDGSDMKYIISYLTDNVIRVRIWPKGQPITTRTWSIVDPVTGDVPFDGRLRHDILSMNHLENQSHDYTSPIVELVENEDELVIKTKTLICKVNLHKTFAITWISGNRTVLQDNPVSSYRYDPSTHYFRHTLCRPFCENEYYHYGLGEKSGYLDKKFRRYRMRNTDAMGYNAEYSDPLYKHIPFYITLRNDHAFGLFYDTNYDCTFDLGCELDNYYGSMLYFETKDPDLDYYFINGPMIENVVERYTALTGRCPLAPKWTLGYLGSAMKYTDASNAQEMLKKFIEKCSKYDIKCTGFHLSSGYSMSSNDGKRYVFVWDQKRVPSPRSMTDNFHQAGMKLLANIKPAMLTTHPHFQRCHSLFIQDSELNQPDLAPFWGGLGAHLDFTNPDTVAWWKDQVIRQLIENGVDCTWNDNNEYNVRNPNGKCFNGEQIDAMRPVQTMLMVKASYDAQATAKTRERRWLLTRAGGAGIQRYAGTWTGDNLCSWHTLKFNIPMGLNLSLSGFPIIGHDVGGFAGEKPSKELFVRWVQNGILHPRFCVHSWRPDQDNDNDDNNENALWMYEDVLPIIHQALKFRERLLFYLYCLVYEASTTGHPIIRPTVYHFQHDVQCRNQSFEFLLGPWLLVASIYEENVNTRTLYLPAGTRWYDFWSDQIYDGGHSITIPVSLDSFPLFVREGALLPLLSEDRLEIRVYPFIEQGTSEFNLYDDDGETMSFDPRGEGKFDLQTIHLKCDSKQIQLQTTIIQGESKAIDWWFPVNERRCRQLNHHLLPQN